MVSGAKAVAAGAAGTCGIWLQVLQSELDPALGSAPTHIVELLLRRSSSTQHFHALPAGRPLRSRLRSSARCTHQPRMHIPPTCHTRVPGCGPAPRFHLLRRAAAVRSTSGIQVSPSAAHAQVVSVTMNVSRPPARADQSSQQTSTGALAQRATVAVERGSGGTPAR